MTARPKIGRPVPADPIVQRPCTDCGQKHALGEGLDSEWIGSAKLGQKRIACSSYPIARLDLAIRPGSKIDVRPHSRSLTTARFRARSRAAAQLSSSIQLSAQDLIKKGG